MYPELMQVVREAIGNLWNEIANKIYNEKWHTLTKEEKEAQDKVDINFYHAHRTIIAEYIEDTAQDIYQESPFDFIQRICSRSMSYEQMGIILYTDQGDKDYIENILSFILEEAAWAWCEDQDFYKDQWSQDALA